MLFEEVCHIPREWVNREMRYPPRMEEYTRVRALTLALFEDRAPLIYAQHLTTDLRNENLLSFSNVRSPNLFIALEAPKCWLDRFESIRGLPPLRVEPTHPYLWLTGTDSWLYSDVPAPMPSNLFPQCSTFYADPSVYFYPSLMKCSELTPEVAYSAATQQVSPAQAPQRLLPTLLESAAWASAKTNLIEQLLEQQPPTSRTTPGKPSSTQRCEAFLFVGYPDVTPKQNAYLDYYSQLKASAKPEALGSTPSGGLQGLIFIKVGEASSSFLIRGTEILAPDVRRLPLSTLQDLKNRRAYAKIELPTYLSIVNSPKEVVAVRQLYPSRHTHKQCATGAQRVGNVYAARLEASINLQNLYQARYGYASGVLNPAYKGLQRLSIRLSTVRHSEFGGLLGESFFWVGPHSNPLQQVPLFPWELQKACLLEYVFPADRSQPTAGFWKLATASELRVHTPQRYSEDFAPFDKPAGTFCRLRPYNNPLEIKQYLRKNTQVRPTYLAYSPNHVPRPVASAFEAWLLKRWIHQQWHIWNLRDWLVEDLDFAGQQPTDPLLSVSWLRVRGFALRFAGFVGLPLQSLFYSPLKILKCVVFCRRLNPRAAEFFKHGWVIPELPLEEDLE